MILILRTPLLAGKMGDGSDTPAFVNVTGEAREKLIGEVADACAIELRDALAKMALLHPPLRAIVNEGLYIEVVAGNDDVLNSLCPPMPQARVPTPPLNARMSCGECGELVRNGEVPAVRILCRECGDRGRKLKGQAAPQLAVVKH